MTLSILCITRNEPAVRPLLLQMSELAHTVDAELVIGDDSGPIGFWHGFARKPRIVPVKSNGSLESVHDEVLDHCRGDFILRLDDDERATPAMEAWLARREYEVEPHWKFARAHLWCVPKRSGPQVLLTPHLWPDHQTRLSIRAMAGGRTVIHCGSPYGGGHLAPVVLEHHKFLVKTLDERRAIVERYNSIAGGAGTAFSPFSVPEDAYKGQSFRAVPMNDGSLDTGHFEQKECGGCGTWVKF